MKANLNNEDYLDDEVSLTEPHFEDEETILAARPVVPLKRVQSNEERGKRRAVGLAIASSLLVGFLGATVVYKLRNQKSPIEVMNTSVPGATGSSTETTARPTVDARMGLANAVGSAVGFADPIRETPTNPKATVVVQPTTSTVKKSAARKSQHIAQATPDEEALSPWEIRRQERHEARREARRRRQPQSGASRIREIFEGSPRP